MKKAIICCSALVIVIAVGAIIYSQSSSSCISASQAWNNVGKHKCVEFKVGHAYTSYERNTFLDQYQNYRTGFAAYIPNGSGVSDSVAKNYLNKTIEVTGTITTYQKAPQIMVSDPSQIKLIN